MIKTVTLEDGVNTVDISGGERMSWLSRPFAHLIVKSGSILVSQTPDIAEGSDGTAATDSYVRVDLTGNKIYMSGAGAVVEIHTSVTATPPFKRAAKGGENGGTLTSVGLAMLLPPIDKILFSETMEE